MELIHLFLAVQMKQLKLTEELVALFERLLKWKREENN
jgi:hypothetical protein